MNTTVLDQCISTYQDYSMYLDFAHEYAVRHSGCTKVAVGCVIVSGAYNQNVVSVGANVVLEDECHKYGCQRVALYGDNHKEHRLPSDCRAVHSEIDALLKMPYAPLKTLTAYITRYPCEACARALALAGITHVIWGREQPISEQTEHIFDLYKVSRTWCRFWKREDNLS